MNNKDAGRSGLKKKVAHELRSYFVNALFLTILIGSFAIYKRILLNDFSNQRIQYGYSIIEALILAKILLIGRSMKLGERYFNKPLIIPVVYKAVNFCLLLFILHFIGFVVIKRFSGYTFNDIMLLIPPKNSGEILAQAVMMFFVFCFFFAFQEISRVLGGTVLFDLFFKGREGSK